MFFTIIIPAYNTAPWLEECLDSIKGQTFRDWECICIDDGSRDNTWEILQKYAAEDSRFKVYHQENKGVSRARNLALEKVQGKYFTFIDSDDIVSEDMLQVWHLHLLQSGSDILMETRKASSFRKKSEVESAIYEKRENVQALTLETKEALKYFHSELLPAGVAMLAQRTYLSSKFKHLRFDETLALSEDSLYFYNIFYLDSSWTFIDISSYFYRARQGSAVVSLSASKRLGNLEVTVRRMEIAKELSGDAELCMIVWEDNRSSVEYRVRGPNDCWNLLSEKDRIRFMDAVELAHKLLGYYPFDFIMRLRLQILHGHFEFIPAALEYLVFGMKKYMKRFFK